MKTTALNKQTIYNVITVFLLGVIMAVLNYKKLGLKDSGMLFLATAVLVYSIILMFKDRKKSILLFIVSLPVLVTARKAVNFDFLIFKLTYESIYAIIIFAHSFRDILDMIERVYRTREKESFNFLIYIGVFLIFALNSTIFSGHFPSSFGHTLLAVIVPVIIALTVLASFEYEDLKKIHYGLMIMVNFSCLYGFFQIFSHRLSFGEIPRNRHLITFGYHNVNIFAGIAVLILPFILEYLLYGKKSIKEKLFLLASLFLNLGGLFITFTRGAWITALFAVFIVLLSKKYIGVIIVGGIGFIAGLKPIMSYILSRGTSTTLLQNESTIARIQAIYTSLIIMFKYPFGAGSGTFAEMYKKFVVEGYKNMPLSFRSQIRVAGYNMEAAHNLWLQIGTELGIVCIIAFMAIILNRVIITLKNFKHNRAELAAILTYLIFSLVTGIEFEHKGVITQTIIIWIIFALVELKYRGSRLNEKIS